MPDFNFSQLQSHCRFSPQRTIFAATLILDRSSAGRTEEDRLAAFMAQYRRGRCRLAAYATG
jgi:hypothetical protein